MQSERVVDSAQMNVHVLGSTFLHWPDMISANAMQQKEEKVAHGIKGSSMLSASLQLLPHAAWLVVSWPSRVREFRFQFTYTTTFFIIIILYAQKSLVSRVYANGIHGKLKSRTRKYQWSMMLDVTVSAS